MRLRSSLRDFYLVFAGGVLTASPSRRRTGLVWTSSMAALGIALWVLGLGEHWVSKAIFVALPVLGTAFFLLIALGITPRPEPSWPVRHR